MNTGYSNTSLHIKLGDNKLPGELDCCTYVCEFVLVPLGVSGFRSNVRGDTCAFRFDCGKLPLRGKGRN